MKQVKMIKLRAKRLFRSNSSKPSTIVVDTGCNAIEWEVRPGGMLVQKRHSGADKEKELIQVRVSTGSKWHDITIVATSTFGK